MYPVCVRKEVVEPRWSAWNSNLKINYANTDQLYRLTTTSVFGFVPIYWNFQVQVVGRGPLNVHASLLKLHCVEYRDINRKQKLVIAQDYHHVELNNILNSCCTCVNECAVKITSCWLQCFVGFCISVVLHFACK